VPPKPDVTAVDAKAKDDGELVDKTEELANIIGRKTRREKHQSSCRAKHGKEFGAVDSAELDMEDSIGDGGKEETQTHEGSNEEMDSDEELHRYDGMLDEAHEGFMTENGEVKHGNPINPYANADLLEKPKEYVVAKKMVHVRDCEGKALVDQRMNTSGPEKVGKEEDAKRRRGRRAPLARKRCIPAC